MLSNQTLTILIILGVLMALTGLFLSSFTAVEDSDFLFRIGLWLIEVAGMFLLLRNGTFLKTRYSRIVMGLLAFTLIGVAFMVMHWPYGTFLLIGGCIGIVISYGIHFFKKPIKKRLDYLKLAWVAVLYIGAVLRLYHLIPRDYRILTTVLMILAVMDYMLPKIKNKTLFE
ncbi:hypothetical protein [Aquimarina sp. MMG016]|uniref:hypothetical protein n=1 Tax=Aquimarina sp. MMG016 TaxID=2822690 RepID=UPI001B3A6B0C|nr:hypothetical protein [Aquimarina sp. MMG016]MBQ4819602.1 hypothetical protein [Aquimarina sp. MMG016]